MTIKKFSEYITGQNLILVSGGVLVAYMALQELNLYLEAKKYNMDKSTLLAVKSDSIRYGLSPKQYIEELNRSKILGFEKFDVYFESKKYGEVNHEEYQAIKKLGLSKAEWEREKEAMKNNGWDIKTYLSLLADQEKRKKESAEQSRLRAQKSIESAATAMAYEIGADGYAECYAATLGLQAIRARGDDLSNISNSIDTMDFFLTKVRIALLREGNPTILLDNLTRNTTKVFLLSPDPTLTILQTFDKCMKYANRRFQ